MDTRVHLKVKIKSLAAEARIIRKEELRADDNDLRESLLDHRRGIVRREARHAQIAYGFLRGRPLKAIEKTDKPIDWAKVRRMVEKYGHRHVNELDEWKKVQ